MFCQEQNRSVAAVLGVGSIAVCVFLAGCYWSRNVEPIFDAHIAEKLNTRWTEASVEHLAFVGRGSKVRTCSVLQLSALLIFREVASSNSQEQEPDNNY
jgi:hypothetical protein